MLALAVVVFSTTGCVGGGAGFMEGNALSDTGRETDSDTEADADGGEPVDPGEPVGPGRIMGLWQEPDTEARVMRYTDDGRLMLAGSLNELDAGAPDTMRWLMSDQTLTLVSLTGICTEASELRLGQYTFEVSSKYLTLTPMSEPCAVRGTVGGKTWNRIAP